MHALQWAVSRSRSVTIGHESTTASWESLQSPSIAPEPWGGERFAVPFPFFTEAPPLTLAPLTRSHARASGWHHTDSVRPGRSRHGDRLRPSPSWSICGVRSCRANSGRNEFASKASGHSRRDHPAVSSVTRPKSLYGFGGHKYVIPVEF